MRAFLQWLNANVSELIKTAGCTSPVTLGTLHTATAFTREARHGHRNAQLRLVTTAPAIQGFHKRSRAFSQGVVLGERAYKEQRRASSREPSSTIAAAAASGPRLQIAELAEEEGCVGGWVGRTDNKAWKPTVSLLSTPLTRATETRHGTKRGSQHGSTARRHDPPALLSRDPAYQTWALETGAAPSLTPTPIRH